MAHLNSPNWPPLSIGFVILLAYAACSEGSKLRPTGVPRCYVHDASFQPDRVLRVTAERYPMQCATRYSVVVNGTVPGPELRFREGDKVWVRVYNDMPDENLTIHWHGLTQRMSPFSDGTPAVSQWPIPPFHYFDYEFQLQPGDAGTYFYHSHVGFGAITAHGALIVDEGPGGRPPIEYDDERILAFSDIFYDNDTYIVDGLMGTVFRWSGETQGLALNGRSILANATASQQGPSCSFGVISVSPGKLYRFRFIGATALSQLYIGIEDHNPLTLIEVDGHYIAPLDVDHIELHAGQRYSILFQAKTIQELTKDRAKGKTQYWFQMETRGRPVITTGYAVLAYDDLPHGPDVFTEPAAPPLVLPNETFTAGWLEDDLQQNPSRPYDDTVPLSNEVTRRIIVNVEQVGIGQALQWFQDGGPWFDTIPPEPYLVSLYKNDTQYFPNYTLALRNGGFDPTTKTFPAKLGEVLEIVWQNLANTAAATVETHPMHVHGDHVWDVSSGTGPFSETVAEAMLQANLKKGGPIKRDTTNLYRTPPPENFTVGQAVSWRAWRIRVKNPGVWMLHCHILQHMMMGMQTVFVFGDREDLKVLTPEQSALYLVYGGPAYGNATYSPRVLHYWHD